MPVRHGGSADPIDAGMYYTRDDEGFFPGLQLTIPEGWLAEETDFGEMKLIPADDRNSLLLMWKDLSPVYPDSQGGHVAGQVIDGADKSAEAIIAWLTSTPSFAILSAPTAVTYGDGIAGTELALTTSDSANFGNAECPDNPHCSALFTDQVWWPPDDFYAIGGAETARIFIAPVHYADGDHTFFVALDVPNSDAVAGMAEKSQPIIDSLILPETWVDQ